MTVTPGLEAQPTPELEAPTPPSAPTQNPPEATPPATPPTPTEPDTFSRAYVEQLRREAADYRTKYQTTNSELETFKQRDMTDLQKAQAEVQKFQTQVIPELQTKNRDLEVKFLSLNLGVHDPDAVTALLDWKAVEAGTPLQDAVKNLLEAKPYLKKADAPAVPTTPPPVAPPVYNPSNSSPANPPANVSGPVSFTKSQLTNMPLQEFKQHEAAIDDAFANGRVDMDH